MPGAFPPLAGNPSVQDSDHVRDVIVNGLEGEIVVFDQTYDAQMPPLPQLSAGQIEAVIGYVQSLGVAPVVTTTTVGSKAGDRQRGEELFVGSIGLRNGGPACYACHAAGPLPGAGLGPDLTGVFGRLGGEAGLVAWLASPPSPTMQPIFADHPLTAEEISDIVGFLGSVETTEGRPRLDGFLIGGFGGAAVLFGLMAVVLRRPRPSYVDRLRSKK